MCILLISVYNKIILREVIKMRNVIRINDGWLFTLDGKTETVNLPHTWNAFDGQDGTNGYLRTKATYSKELPKSDRKRSSNAEESTQRRKSESTTSLSQSTRADIPHSESISPTTSDTAAALT